LSTWEKRLIELALDAVGKICEGCKEDERKSFRARARSLISDMYASGVAYVVSLAAARSSARAVELGLTANSLDDIIVKLCGDREHVKELGLGGAEDRGYALYGSLLLYALRQAGVLSAGRLSEAIKSLWGNAAADRVALHAATWLKRFAEAYIYE